MGICFGYTITTVDAHVVIFRWRWWVCVQTRLRWTSTSWAKLTTSSGTASRRFPPSSNENGTFTPDPRHSLAWTTQGKEEGKRMNFEHERTFSPRSNNKTMCIGLRHTRGRISGRPIKKSMYCKNKQLQQAQLFSPSWCGGSMQTCPKSIYLSMCPFCVHLIRPIICTDGQ